MLAREHTAVSPPLPSPSSPTYRVHPPSIAGSSSSQDTMSTSPATRGDEIGLLRHQVRLLKAENSNLREKLGTKHNPAPFGQSLPRRPSEPPLATRRPSGSSGPGDDRSTSPLPGAVSLTRALLPDSDPSSSLPLPPLPPPDRVNLGLPSPPPEGRSPTLNGTRASVENPFFGSGASRERMKASAASAQSGSGKVIAGLQSELLQVRSALDAARAQLRLSQRAVEHLTRQNDDLKEAKERLGSEGSGLGKMLARKERLQDELAVRAKTAEAALATLQAAHQTLARDSAAQIEALERETARKEEQRARAESEYGALRAGMKSMADGWRAELDWVHADLAKVEARHQREVDDSRLKHATLTKLFKAREAEHSNVKTTVNALSVSHKAFIEKSTVLLSQLSTRLESADSAKIKESHAIAVNLDAELKRLRRMMRQHSAAGGGG